MKRWSYISPFLDLNFFLSSSKHSNKKLIMTCHDVVLLYIFLYMHLYLQEKQRSWWRHRKVDLLTVFPHMQLLLFKILNIVLEIQNINRWSNKNYSKLKCIFHQSIPLTKRFLMSGGIYVLISSSFFFGCEVLDLSVLFN